jgi:hypothetical protein
MTGARYGKRLGDARRRLKGLLYAKLGSLLLGDPDTENSERAVRLFQRLCELEKQDGDRGLERLLNVLPKDFRCQVLQEVKRLIDEDMQVADRGTAKLE